jgi:nucleoid-associated protein YgaU
MAAQRTGRVPPRVRVAVHGLLALTALATLLIGLPVLLLALGADPLSARVPSGERLRQLLASPDDGTLLLGVLRVAAWAGWVALVVSVAVEVATAAAGRAAPVLWGLTAIQRPAAFLIAAVAATIASPAAASAATPEHATAFAITVPGPGSGPWPATTPGLGPPEDPSTGPRPVEPTSGHASVEGWTPTPEPTRIAAAARARADRLPAVRVGRYDSLWRIAERTLGDGRRWSEIYRLNAGRPQPEEARLTDPNTIVEGWTLLLPADATGTDATGTDATCTGATGARAADSGVPATKPPGLDSTADTRDVSRGAPSQHAEIVVRPGDTLSGLAQRHLGTAHATGALYQANVGRRSRTAAASPTPT